MSKLTFSRVMIIAGPVMIVALGLAAKKESVLSPSGREIYMDRCAACHGEDAKGNGPSVGALKVAPSDLTLLAKRNGGAFPAERVKNIVGGWANLAVHGSREMPIWGDLFLAKNPLDQQVAAERFKNLVAYLESVQE